MTFGTYEGLLASISKDCTITTNGTVEEKSYKMLCDVSVVIYVGKSLYGFTIIVANSNTERTLQRHPVVIVTASSWRFVLGTILDELSV